MHIDMNEVKQSAIKMFANGFKIHEVIEGLHQEIPLQIRTDIVRNVVKEMFLDKEKEVKKRQKPYKDTDYLTDDQITGIRALLREGAKVITIAVLFAACKDISHTNAISIVQAVKNNFEDE